jgi:hypothetical protein
MLPPIPSGEPTCEKCVEIDITIERFRRIQRSISDDLTVDRAKAVIVELKKRKPRFIKAGPPALASNELATPCQPLPIALPERSDDRPTRKFLTPAKVPNRGRLSWRPFLLQSINKFWRRRQACDPSWDSMMRLAA